MANTITMKAGDELPYWSPAFYIDGTVVDMSSGWTFTVTVAEPGSTTALFTKTTGITGTTTGCTVAWATSAELSTLTAGRAYVARCRARRTADSRDATAEITLKIDPVAA